MPLRALVIFVAVLSCQRPAEHIDVDVENLAKVTDVTPVSVTRPTFELPPTPPLVALATVSSTPDSAALHVIVKGASGGEVAVEWLTPDGTMYQREAQPLVEAPFGEQPFDFSLPIAGTWISANELYGQWSAHVFVGASELTSQQFMVGP